MSLGLGGVHLFCHMSPAHNVDGGVVMCVVCVVCFV